MSPPPDPAIALACRHGISLQAARARLAKSQRAAAPLPPAAAPREGGAAPLASLAPPDSEPGKPGGRGERPSVPNRSAPAVADVKSAPATPGIESAGPDDRGAVGTAPVHDSDKTGASPHPTDPVGCRWIDGDPRSPDWRFCQKATAPGRSYCPHHAERAYKRVTP